MRLKIQTATISLLVCLASVNVTAVDIASFSEKADAYLLSLAREGRFSGTVLVAKNQNPVFARGYGLANREHDIDNTTNTIFRLGSVTKQFTAMCILILQEQHKLAVTDLISEYVEDCPEAWRGITIHHLLTHTSGIPNFSSFPDNEHFERLPTTPTATVQRFKDKPLDFEPGTHMRYSNSGYVLLGYIIEKVAGQSYEQFVTERIFRPLGMEHSGYDRPATILPNRAAGYAMSGTTIVNCVPFAMDTPHAAGALYSTVGDLLIWDNALYTERLVTAKSLESMFTEYTGNYCYGWFRGDVDGRTVYAHAGGISGFTSCVMRFPTERVYIAVLSNFEHNRNEPQPVPQHVAKQLQLLLFDSEQ